MVRPSKTATPSLAVTVSVPPSVAPVGLLASAMVTVPLKDGSTWPAGSSAATTTPNWSPAMTWAGGCAVTAIWLAAP